jgi:CSLREA domain-containing protein
MRRFLAGAIAVSALALPATASAATFSVTTTADTPVGAPCTDPTACSLRGAITAANALATDDTVSVTPGTYHLANGQLSITDGTFLQRSGSSGTVTIDADGLSRVLDISAAASLTNLTITDGRATDVPGGGAGAAGGGIYASADIALDGMTLIANRADSAGAGDALGGGLYADGQLSVGGGASTFRDNAATATGTDAAYGGGIYVAEDGFGNLGGLVLRDNEVTSDAGPSGGAGLASFGSGAINFYRGLVDGNTAAVSGSGAATGGGVAAAAGTFTVSDVRITGNTARSATGPAIGGGMATSNTPTIARSTFDANEAATGSGPGTSGAYGGGLWSLSPSAIAITNSTFTANTASAAGDPSAVGGGLATGYGPTTLTGVTLTGNTSTNTVTPNAASAGGAAVTSSAFTVTGSILSGNTQGVGPDCIGTPTSGGGNVLFATAGPTNPDCQVALGSDDVLTDDPDLGTLGDHGGPTPTLLPNLGSPALDRYAPTVSPATCATLTVDQRDIARPQGSACDAGAVESRPATFTADPAALHFGSVDTGSTSPGQDVTLTNVGDLAAIPALGLTGSDPSSFTRSGCTTPVPAGLPCNVSVGFAPAAAGALSATLTGASPSVALDGTGTTPSGGGGSTPASGGDVPQCRDLDASTAFATPVALTLDCSATVWSWQVLTPPAHGTVSAIGPTGQLTYTPADGFSGDDAFQYIAEGAGGRSTPATAVVHVGPGPLVVTTSGSTAKACTPRTVTVRLNAHGVHFTRVRVSVAGVLVKPKLTRTVWKATFALKGTQGQKVTVHISGRRTDGKLVTTKRALTAC